MSANIKKVLRKDRSPMNPKIWVMQLECGHDVYAKKSYVCEKCGSAL